MKSRWPLLSEKRGARLMMVVLHRYSSHSWVGFYLSGLLSRSRIQKKKLNMGDSRRHEANLSLQRTSCDKQLCSPHEFPVSFFCQLCHFKSRLKNIWHFCHRQQSASHGLVRENTWVFLFKLEVDCELKLEKKKKTSTRAKNRAHHVSSEVLTTWHRF